MTTETTPTATTTAPGAATTGLPWRIDEPPHDDHLRVRFVLVRHGQTEWNAQRIIQGHLGPGLNPTGQDQALAAAHRLRTQYTQPDVVYTSDLPRCVETATMYTNLAGHPELAFRQDARLREIDNGNWSGRPIDEVATAEHELVERIRAGEDLPRGGAETVTNMRARVRELVNDVVTEAETSEPQPWFTAVLFTHGGTIRAATSELLGLGAGMKQLVGPANCSITTIETWARHGKISAAVLRDYNRSDHTLSLNSTLDPTEPTD